MALILEERDKPKIAGMAKYGRARLLREVNGAEFWVLDDVPPHVRIRLKQLFKSVPITEVHSFKFRHLPMNCADLEWFQMRYPMEMAPEDRAALVGGRQEFEKIHRDNEEIMMPGWTPPVRYGFRPGFEAYEGQKQAAELLLRTKRLLVMDDVGLGKTVVALWALAGSEYLPAAIVVQSHVASQWLAEFIKPMTYMSAHIVKGTKPYTLPPANLYIFKYSNMAAWSDIAATGVFKAVVFDEIQELRHGEATNKGKAARIFVDNAKLKLGLSASPIFNYGSEIFHIIEMIEPGALGSWEDFTREWCTLDGNHWIVNDPEALGTWLREKHLVVRRERPGRPVNKIPLELEWDDDAAKKDSALARTLAMRVLTGSFHDSGMAARELDLLLRQQTGIAKARAVAAYTRMLVESGKPVVLFGWHREVYNIWNRELADLKPLMYTGSESTPKKDRAKKGFINGDTDLIIMSLRSGAGLDGIQTRCSTVVFGELDWTPKVHDPQCIGRVDRPGQKADEITAIYCWTNGGSDPLVMGVHGIKASQAKGIVDPTKGVEHVYSDVSRVKQLAAQYLEQVRAA